MLEVALHNSIYSVRVVKKVRVGFRETLLQKICRSDCTAFPSRTIKGQRRLEVVKLAIVDLYHLPSLFLNMMIIIRLKLSLIRRSIYIVNVCITDLRMSI